MIMQSSFQLLNWKPSDVEKSYRGVLPYSDYFAIIGTQNTICYAQADVSFSCAVWDRFGNSSVSSSDVFWKTLKVSVMRSESV